MGILQEFNINELAGATGLILGALGGLLAVIWKSRCHCKMNLCYICQCERKKSRKELLFKVSLTTLVFVGPKMDPFCG